MSELLERVKLNLLVNGSGIVENFQKNSAYFFECYQRPTQLVRNISNGKIQLGRFYHFHYMDNSNWMKYSPIFTVDVRKISNLIIIYAVNLNFIPLEFRVAIFDSFITDKDLDKNQPLGVSFEGVYNALKRYGFEYAIMEYNLAQIQLVHDIDMALIPRFLYSGHPINKYDPNKLMEIWSTKLKNRDARDAEIHQLLVEHLTVASDDVLENYQVLRGHIQRFQDSLQKFGRP